MLTAFLKEPLTVTYFPLSLNDFVLFLLLPFGVWPLILFLSLFELLFDLFLFEDLCYLVDGLVPFHEFFVVASALLRCFGSIHQNRKHLEDLSLPSLTFSFQLFLMFQDEFYIHLVLLDCPFILGGYLLFCLCRRFKV